MPRDDHASDAEAPPETIPVAPQPHPDVHAAAPPDDTHARRCRDAADIAFQVIAHLAARGIEVDKDDFEAIHDACESDGETGPAAREHRFWSAYARIVGKLEPGEDAEGIYYTALFETEGEASLSPSSAIHLRALRLSSRVIASLTMALLGLLIVSLAYGSIVNNLVATAEVLRAERQAIRANQLAGTRLALLTDLDCTAAGLSKYSRDLCDGVEVTADIEANKEMLETFVFWMAPNSGATELSFAAKQTFFFLENYAYPLLAGALGACVFLLRSIFAQLALKRLHLRLYKALYLRVAVGTVAGIVVGWLASSEGQGGISLKPLALAFVAGYGVEVIYSILDRIVGAFSSGAEPGPSVPRPAPVRPRPVVPPGAG